MVRAVFVTRPLVGKVLIAALIACGDAAVAPIDYESVAKPLPAVLEELSKQSGVQMRASKAIEEDRLVIRVRDADIATLREKIAEAVAGNWSEKDACLRSSEMNA